MTEIAPLLPSILLCGGAFVLLFWDVLSDRVWPRGIFTSAVVTVSILSLILVQGEFIPSRLVMSGTLYADPIAWYFSVLILFGTLITLFLTMGVTRQYGLAAQGIEAEGEFYFLLLSASAGAIWLVSSAEMITLFLALEILSMALYCLCGSALGSRSSSESALKYFLLGSFASAFLLFGMSFLYGATGTFSIEKLPQLIQGADPLLIKLGLGFMLIGMLFKLSAVPFHFWAPDVYDGAPTSVTAFMACVVKAAAVGVLLRVLWGAFGDATVLWNGAVWVVAALTMVVGNLIAVRQTDVKRMLAYSSISHAGYLLIPVLSTSGRFVGGEYGGGGAVLFYLASYMLMTFGAFAIVLTVGNGSQKNPVPHHLNSFAGLAKNHPWMAGLMSLFLLSLAGLPPGMAGLLGKFYIFSAGVKSHNLGLVIIAALCSAISCYYYLRVIVAMYFNPSEEIKPDSISMNFPTAFAAVICAVLVLVVGILPTPFFNQAAIVAASL
jgi:NADH-quinone oxidoreductase subunit N